MNTGIHTKSHTFVLHKSVTRGNLKMTPDRARFEWDDAKDRQNQLKHGIPFALAQLAFLDPRRVVVEDLYMAS